MSLSTPSFSVQFPEEAQGDQGSPVAAKAHRGGPPRTEGHPPSDPGGSHTNVFFSLVRGAEGWGSDSRHMWGQLMTGGCQRTSSTPCSLKTDSLISIQKFPWAIAQGCWPTLFPGLWEPLWEPER